MSESVSPKPGKIAPFLGILLFLAGAASARGSTLPANLLISSKASPHHVILVEKASQRLLLYRFDGDYHLVASYPCATGEKNGDKQARGDRKTPEGIYFFTRDCNEKYLSPVYGARAFPMNYPNLIDRRQGKDGAGIWLHGINEQLRPHSTNGCIAMSNEDIVRLDLYIKLWKTPIIIEEKLSYEEPALLRRQGRFFLEQIDSWRRAWAAKELDRYLSFYASGFRWKNLDLQGWRKKKARLNRLYKVISVQLSDIRLFRQGNTVLAASEEVYRSDRFASHGFKYLYLVQNSWQWRILGEQWRQSDRLPPPPLRLVRKESEPSGANEASVRTFLDRWRRAWEQGTISEYLSCYHPRFESNGMNRQGWKDYKQNLFTQCARRDIVLSDVRIQLRHPTAVVAFKQRYRATNHQDYGMKRLHLRRYKGRWTILKETWRPLPEQT